jgi:2-succinyl-6-hydroxy-2,4-cyclohexadiene-1-carboxylate synthase
MTANTYCIHGFLGLPSDWDFLPTPLNKVDPYEFMRKYRNPNSELQSEPKSEIADWALAFNESVLEAPRPRILMGYSMGGRLALHALIRNPSLWDAAVLVSTHLGMPETDRAARLISDEHWAKRFETENWTKVVRAWDANPAFCGRPNPFNREQSKELFHRADLAYALRYWSTGHQNDLLPRAAQLEMPILWVTGQEDRRYSEFSRQIQSRLSAKNQHNWSFWEAPGAGHRVPWEAQGAFRKHFSGFLNKVLLGERYDPEI